MPSYVRMILFVEVIVVLLLVYLIMNQKLVTPLEGLGVWVGVNLLLVMGVTLGRKFLS